MIFHYAISCTILLIFSTKKIRKDLSANLTNNKENLSAGFCENLCGRKDKRKDLLKVFVANFLRCLVKRLISYNN